MSDYSTETTGQHVTAFFDSRSDAEAAIERIVGEGVSRDHVRLVEGRDDTAATAPQEEKGFFEALGDFFMPDEDRATYAEGLHRGGYLVSVTTGGRNRDRILDILDDEGTVDMDAREQSWRAEGWTGATRASGDMIEGGYAETGTRSDSTAGMGGRGGLAEGTIEVVEEQMRIGKREVDHGRVRVRSYMVEEPVEEQVSLHDESIHVERHAVDRKLGAGEAAFADRTLEATETAEEAVVSKEARVTEEISLHKEKRDHTETVRDSVRHTEVEIDDERLERGDTDRVRDI